MTASSSKSKSPALASFPFKQLKNQRGLALILGLTVMVFFILYLQALNSSWRGHLEVDTWNWFRRVEHFRENFSFAGIENKEFLPATLLFILLPASLFGLAEVTYGQYLQGVLVVNLIILGLHVLIIRNQTDVIKTVAFLLILLFFGPIILFRYDALATLMVLTSIWAYRRKSLILSGLFLGIGSSVKVYPLILLPYFLLTLLSGRKKIRQLALFLVGFGVAAGSAVVGLVLLGGSLDQFTQALQFHSMKSVSVESVPGVIMTGVSLLVNNAPSQLIGGYGIWGVQSAIVESVGLWFFNYLWVLPVGLTYAYLAKARHLTAKFSVAVLFWIVLVFLIFSKNLNPQYLFWFLALFPLLKPKVKGLLDHWLVYFLILVSVYLTQNVYPRLYTNFIENFFGEGVNVEIYLLQLIRNLGLLAVAVVGFRAVFLKRSIR